MRFHAVLRGARYTSASSSPVMWRSAPVAGERVIRGSMRMKNLFESLTIVSTTVAPRGGKS